MDEKSERKIAHLAMIQAVIARMASNSFALKTLSVTLCAGVIALLGAVQKPAPAYVIAAILPVLVFWWMDAKYLQLERLYRALYDEIRMGDDSDPFAMSVSHLRGNVQPVLRIAISWSVNAIYMTLLIVVLVVARSVLTS